MGLNPLWQEDVCLTVQDLYHQAHIHVVEPYFIIACNNTVFIHLVPLQNDFTPIELIELQAQYQKNGTYLVQLWQDVWQGRRKQVLSRLHSFLGLNKSVHGRKARVGLLSAQQSRDFLNEYHLQGHVRAKYNYGLFNQDELIAVAGFSGLRPMKHKGAHYQSAELVRFASKDGLTIVGGLSKLIKHFTKQVNINDLMTYADRDWSIGKGYETLGFALSASTAPAIMYVNTHTWLRYFPHRLPKILLAEFEAQNVLNLDDFLVARGYLKLFNTGNLKYHLYF